MGLEVGPITVQYGGVTAVRGVQLTVERGEVVGLIGPNGSGKTTLIDAITGFVASAGPMSFDGIEFGDWSAARRVRNGISRTFQSAELFDDLTVRENLLVASDPHTPFARLLDLFHPSRGRSAETALVDKVLDRFEILEHAEKLPTDLTTGLRRVVGLARAVAAEPQLLLCDEPAAGLDSGESARFGQHIRSLATAQRAVILVEHDMELILATCDRVYVVDFGEVIFEGDPQVAIRDRRVLRAFLGEDGAELSSILGSES
jgi:branched-chain amino acid transport system ATP-binding protein